MRRKQSSDSPSVDPKHSRRVSAEEAKAIDDALGIESVTIRFDKEVPVRVKELAKQEGLIPVAYIRRLAANHVGLSGKKASQSGLRFGKYKWICICGTNIWDDDQDTDRSCVSCGLNTPRRDGTAVPKACGATCCQTFACASRIHSAQARHIMFRLDQA